MPVLLARPDLQHRFVELVCAAPAVERDLFGDCGTLAAFMSHAYHVEVAAVATQLRQMSRALVGVDQKHFASFPPGREREVEDGHGLPVTGPGAGHGDDLAAHLG